MQAEQLLCWSGMIDTEQTTSGSNEEEYFLTEDIRCNQLFNFEDHAGVCSFNHLFVKQGCGSS